MNSQNADDDYLLHYCSLVATRQIRSLRLLHMRDDLQLAHSMRVVASPSTLADTLAQHLLHG